MIKVRSSHSCTELSKTQFFPVSIVKQVSKYLLLSNISKAIKVMNQNTMPPVPGAQKRGNTKNQLVKTPTISK